MYTPDGIRVISPLGKSPPRTIPWDRIQNCRLKDGRHVIRHELKLKKEHFPIFVIGNGIGGFRRSHDVGRLLVVDRIEDGSWIDYIE